MSTPQSSRLRIAIAGLRFGAEFAPIYRRHPDVGSVVLCDPNEAALNRTGDTLGITERFTRLEDVLADSTVDAVHVVSPVRFHAEQVLATLNAGKHCACAVPMATREEDIRAILAARRRSGKNYMMMETAVYTREFLYVRDLHARGDLGNLTFLRGAHLQDIEALPDYWKGYPPMLYITHALSPLLALVGARAEVVSCFGSGTLRPDLRAVPGYNQRRLIPRKPKPRTKILPKLNREELFVMEKEYQERHLLPSERIPCGWISRSNGTLSRDSQYESPDSVSPEYYGSLPGSKHLPVP